MISLHASSFAAFIGKNPYTKHHEAFEKTWQRASPETYSAALRRNNRMTDQHCLELVRSKIPEIDVTLHAAETSTPGTATAVVENRTALTAEIEGDLTAHEKKLVGDEIRKQLFTRYGTSQERSVLDILVDDMGMELTSGDETYRRMFMTANGVPWKLVGKIDAYNPSEKTIIEVKNRVNRLFMHATEYERIQVECYMRLIEKAERALLVESLCTGDGVGRTLNIIPLQKNNEDWSTWYHLAEMYVEYLNRMIHDESLQDTYLQSKRPTAFLRKILE